MICTIAGSGEQCDIHPLEKNSNGWRARNNVIIDDQFFLNQENVYKETSLW